MVHLQSWVAFQMTMFSENLEVIFFYSCFSNYYANDADFWLKVEDGFGWSSCDSLLRYSTNFYPHILMMQKP